MIDIDTRYSVDHFRRAERRVQILSVLVLITSVALIGAIGFVVPVLAPLVYAGIIGLLLALLIWYRPVYSVYTLIAGTILLEQWPIEGLAPVTLQVPFYGSLAGFMNLPYLPSPLEMLLALSLGIVLFKAIVTPNWQLTGGKFTIPLSVFLLTVVVSLMFGVTGVASTPGDFSLNAAWAEMRSFVYLAIAYFLAANLITDRTRVNTFMWIVVVAIGIKGLQGVARFATEQQLGVNLQALTGHEDVIFLTVGILLLASLWIFGGHHRQTVWLFLFFPPVAFTMFATTRRMAFIVLGFSIILFGLALLREKRETFFKLAPVVLAIVLIYLTAYWDRPHTLAGQPVRAIQSQIGYTDQRDFLSDHWRELENINLEANIRSAPFTGLGFGREYEFFVYQPSLDATGFIYWTYITHNAIFWVWMKMGIFGWIAFWWLFGFGLVLSLNLFRTLPDSYLRSVALFVALSTLGVLVFAYGDLGLTYARPMLFLGLLFGVLSRLPSIAEHSDSESPESNAPHSQPTRRTA